MTVFKQARGWFSRYRRDAAGNVSVTFTLFLVPLCGLLAMAIGMGNGVLMQRSEQHAADSAALAAATGANVNCYDSSGNTSASVSMSTSGATSGQCVTTSTGAVNPAYTAGYQLEAKAVAASFTQISGATVTPAMAYCPGTTSGAYDCYKVTISRTAPLYFGSVVGIRNIQPTAVAYARSGVYQDDCLIGTKTTGTAVSIQGSTDVSSCYARGNAQVDCSGGSVPFVGVIAPSETSSCKAPLTVSTTTFSDPSDTTRIANALAAKAPSTVPCSTSVLSLTWSAVDANNTQYARVCSPTTTTLKLNANLEIGSNSANRVLYVDNVSIDLSGYTLSATNFSGSASSHTGTTIVGVNYTSTATPVFKSKNSNGTSDAQGAWVKVIGPTDDQADPFHDYALVVDPSISAETWLNDQKNGNSPISFNILGVVFAPMSDFTLGGSNTSDFTSISSTLSCSSIVAYTIVGNGSKLTAAGCSSLGYVTPKDFFASVALVA